jgi:4-diphosphocytidyl-2-C-methyl-D-erythritol kinase
MHVRRLPSRIEVLTPAKINLFLAVLGKRPDGYHDIETVMAAVGTYDSLIAIPRSGEEITVESRWTHAALPRQPWAGGTRQAAHELLYGEIPRGPSNLVWQAAELLRQRAGHQGGAAIWLVKRIPLQAGLGGASSDAAAALVAANEAWGLGWTRERLWKLAAELGSDVAFFLQGGAAVCRGRGERIETIQACRLHVVIVRPPVGLSTADVYRRCRPAATPRGAGPMTAALARGDAAAVSRELVNDLQPAASELTPWIADLQTEFQNHELTGHQMSGSGSSYFGLCRSARHGRRVAARLRARSIGQVMSAST